MHRFGFCLLFLVCLFSPPVHAQNTGGIFPPMVSEGHSSLQYRVTYGISAQAAAQRVHYQRSLNDALMWRVLAQLKHSEDSPADFQHVQGELFWDLSDKEDWWKTGFRLDARVRTSGATGMVGLHWTNQIRLADNWHMRAVFLSATDIGGDSPSGLGLQTRGNLFTTLPGGPTLGVEFYNAYGSTVEFKSLPDQKHQVGPFSFIPVGPNWTVFVGLLAGLTPGTETLDIRSWLNYTF